MPKCFVIMGFGEKTDLATGRKLDLDKTYKNIIKPAVAAAGYDCVRADEILHSGVIDVPMYDLLLTADLVVADLSTANLNAMFELGVRHALRPRSTIIIAESQFRTPFDTNHIVIQPYVHLGPDIGFEEALRLRDLLQKLASALATSDAVDSPVYTVMRDLVQPMRKTMEANVSRAACAAPPEAGQQETFAALYDLALKAKNDGDFDLARDILTQVYHEQRKPGPDGNPQPAPPRVSRELALATYKAGEKAAETGGPEVALDAYAKAAELLQALGPETTTDPETLGLWSAIHKRRAEMPTQPDDARKADLEIAIHAAERGYLIRGDNYTGTNLAYLLNLRASLSAGDDRIADRVFADRIRRKIVAASTERLKTLEAQIAAAAQAGASAAFEEARYWTTAGLAESLIALGDPSGPALMQQALASAPAAWMAETTTNQLEKLKKLLTPKNPDG